MSWLDLAPDDPFGVHNVPYCVVAGSGPAVRIGDRLLDLPALDGLVGGPFAAGGNLDAFLAGGRTLWTEVRDRLTDLLTAGRWRSTVEPHLRPVAGADLVLPFTVADYVDFYASEHHATNLGRLLRPGEPPLLPNWKHLPVGYHGRAGTVVVSGTPIRRPRGQLLDGDTPTYGPTRRLDIEAEIGFVVGVPSTPGTPLGTGDFADHVFGAVVVNDWSARDIQAWEYRPLGPFLGKSFATSVSPYVVPLAALAAARVPAPDQDPPVLAYLREVERYTYDIRLEVTCNGTVLSTPPFAGLYWTPAQQLAHLTANGARVRTGDLFASGTVSGPTLAETGSLIERTRGGTEPVRLADGASRTYLEDGDTVMITAVATATAGCTMIGFGGVHATITAW